jgi:hypothetical protein
MWLVTVFSEEGWHVMCVRRHIADEHIHEYFGTVKRSRVADVGIGCMRVCPLSENICNDGSSVLQIEVCRNRNIYVASKSNRGGSAKDETEVV